MLRFSEIKPLFVDLSLSDKSFLFFVQCGGGCLWRTIIRTGTDMDVHCSHSAFLTDCTSRLHSAVIQCLSVFRNVFRNVPKHSF